MESDKSSKTSQNAEKETSAAAQSYIDVESGAGNGSDPRPGMKGLVWPLVVVSILSSHFLYAFDNTVVANVQPEIIERFGEIEKLPWISVGFVFAFASITLTWGKLFQIVDAKYTFLSAVLVFEIGTAVCGSAPSMNALIVGRVLCGLGAAGIYTGAMILIGAFTTIKERPAYFGLAGITWGLGTVLGPVIGGAFAANPHTTWRWGFYIVLCIGGLTAPVFITLLPSYTQPDDRPVSVRLRQFDYVGAVLLIGAFIAGTCAIAFGGNLYSWDSGRIIGLFCCLGVLLFSFILQQSFSILTTAEHRIFPAAMMWSKDMNLLFIQAAASNACAFIPIYFIPLYFQFVRNDGALESAVRLLPYICLFVAAAMSNGIFMAKTGYYLPWYIGGAILSLIGGVLMFRVDQSTPVANIYGYSVLIAVGAGSVNPACWAVSQAKAPGGNFTAASAFIGLSNALSSTLTLTVSNTVFLNVTFKRLVQILPEYPRSEVKAAIAGTDAVLLRSLPPAQRVQALNAVTYGLSRVYIMLIFAASLSLAAAAFMKWEKLFVDPPTTDSKTEMQDENGQV